MRIVTSNQLLIRLAWGNRTEYPSHVEADHKLWLKWIWRSLPTWFRAPVSVSERTHKRNYINPGKPPRIRRRSAT